MDDAASSSAAFMILLLLLVPAAGLALYWYLRWSALIDSVRAYLFWLSETEPPKAKLHLMPEDLCAMAKRNRNDSRYDLPSSGVIDIKK